MKGKGRKDAVRRLKYLAGTGTLKVSLNGLGMGATRPHNPAARGEPQRRSAPKCKDTLAKEPPTINGESL